MKEERSALFTTGQFAKLCGTTKDTLFHYDALGLLKPVKTGENGYRYYAAAQFFDFDLILALQEAGSPLKEIKGYLEHREPHSFAQLLRENEKKLAGEVKRLEKMRRILKNAVTAAEAALSGVYEAPWLEECPEEWYVATPVQGDVLQMRDLVRSMQDHFAYCDARGLGEELAVGSIVTKESLLRGDYRESFYSTRLPRRCRTSRLYQKPAGLYACILHKGDYSGLLDTYPLLLRWLSAQGLRVCGDSFETDLLSYLASGDEQDFVLKLAVQVEKNGQTQFARDASLP